MTKDVSKQIATLEDELQKLRAQQLEELREKRGAAQKVVDDIDAQIAAITGKRAAIGTRKRTRTSPAKMRSEILGALAKNPNGLTAMEITEKTIPRTMAQCFCSYKDTTAKSKAKESEERSGCYF